MCQSTARAVTGMPRRRRSRAISAEVGSAAPDGVVLGRASRAGGAASAAADSAREHARRAQRLFVAAGAQAPDQLAELAAARS
jgi:hypothetical protein